MTVSSVLRGRLCGEGLALITILAVPGVIDR